MSLASQLVAAFQTIGAEAKSVRRNRVYRVRYNNTVANAYDPRPGTDVAPAGMCEYVGPSAPTDWLSGDTWTQV